MDVSTISEELSVSPQIVAEDIETIADLEFRSIICNRPEGEGTDQPTFDEIVAKAKEAGLKSRYIPITAGKVSDDNAAVFGEAMRALPKPVLA